MAVIQNCTQGWSWHAGHRCCCIPRPRYRPADGVRMEWWAARRLGTLLPRTTAPKVPWLLHRRTGCWVARRDQPDSSILGTWQYLRQLMVHELLPNSIGTDGTGLNK